MRFLVLSFALLAAGCDPAGFEDSAAPKAQAEPAEGGPPTIYAKASADDVAETILEFEKCAEAIDYAMREGQSAGQAFNAARAASMICEQQVQNITEARSHAPDFRVTDCRQAAFAGHDLAESQMAMLNSPTEENQGQVEIGKHGFNALGDACRHPDEELLNQAVKG